MKKPAVAQSLKKFPALYETERSKMCSQETSIDLYPELNKFSSYIQSCFSKIHFNTSSRLHTGLHSVLSFRFSYKNTVCTSLFSPMHATSFFYFILLYSVILIIFDRVCEWWSSSWCNVSHSPIISFLWWHFRVPSSKTYKWFPPFPSDQKF
jgi:hypothetical protein